MTCLIILAHFFHSQSFTDTIIWKHHSNSMTNMINGNASITLYTKSFARIIGSSHSNHPLSNLGTLISETGASSPNDKLFEKELVLLFDFSDVFSWSQFHISVMF